VFPGCELMDRTESQKGDAPDNAAAEDAAEGLRGQIAALRQQVREAQDTLRDHERRQDSLKR